MKGETFTEADRSELEKLALIQENIDVIALFLEYLRKEKGIFLATGSGEGIIVASVDIQREAAEYFGVDIDRAEQQRNHLLEKLRQEHNPVKACSMYTHH